MAAHVVLVVEQQGKTVDIRHQRLLIVFGEQRNLRAVRRGAVGNQLILRIASVLKDQLRHVAGLPGQILTEDTVAGAPREIEVAHRVDDRLAVVVFASLDTVRMTADDRVSTEANEHPQTFAAQRRGQGIVFTAAVVDDNDKLRDHPFAHDRVREPFHRKACRTRLIRFRQTEFVFTDRYHGKCDSVLCITPRAVRFFYVVTGTAVRNPRAVERIKGLIQSLVAEVTGVVVGENCAVTAGFGQKTEVVRTTRQIGSRLCDAGTDALVKNRRFQIHNAHIGGIKHTLDIG